MVERMKNRIRSEFYESFKSILEELNNIPNLYKYDEEQDSLALSIFRAKYMLKDDEREEYHPEDVYRRVASFIAAIDNSNDKIEIGRQFFEIMRNGYFIPGGRVLAGAGDIRAKTLANCFVSIIENDSIEAIYKAAYEAARTYSYGGGIGIDISVLRPTGAIVHNASNTSTGAVSFMHLYSLTTGLIGQEGRRGALMLTIHVKHPDIMNFILSKSSPNYDVIMTTNLIKQDLALDERQAKMVQKRIIENFQIRYANISIKFTDEFFHALQEAINYKDKILMYKVRDYFIPKYDQDYVNVHYSYDIPSKPIDKYILVKVFNNVSELSEYMEAYGIKNIDLDDVWKRDIYGDLVITLDGQTYTIRRAGDFLTIFASQEVGEIRKMYNALDIWNMFVISNYKFAEPGLIFWSHMVKHSNSDYIGRRILGTNPCSEVPLEDGGSCNLGSLNLVRFVKNPFEDNAEIDYDLLDRVIKIAVRFMDNVVEWNIYMNPLPKQRESARLTRRVGLGVMGLADMLMALKLNYDDEKSISLVEKVMKFIVNRAYYYSIELAKERGTFEAYSNSILDSPFIKENLDPEIRKNIERYGLRNVALLSIAPTGSISNIVIAYVDKDRIYTGVSGGIEPVFSISYTRYSENLRRSFHVFHSSIRYWMDKHRIIVDNPENIELPNYLTRTAHGIDWVKRIEIQSRVQKYVDHSISSTINLPEDVHPDTISKLYMEAWRRGLKGVTIYREGSRFAILNTNSKRAKELEEYKNGRYMVERYDPVSKTIIKEEIGGLEPYVRPDGTITTVWHDRLNRWKLDGHKNKNEGMGNKEMSKCPVCGKYTLVIENGCHVCLSCGYGKCE